MSRRKKTKTRVQPAPVTPRASSTGADDETDGAQPILRWGRVVGAGVSLALIVCVIVFLATPPGQPLPDDAPPGDAPPAATRQPAVPTAEQRPPTIDIPTEPAEATAQQLRQELVQLSDELLAQFPQSAEALHVVALLYLDLQKTKDAARIWRQCIELAPNKPGPYVGLARAAMELGDDQLAVDAVRRANDAGCSSAELDYELAAALTKLGRLEEAELVLQTATAAADDSAQLWRQLGQVQSQLGNFEQAEASLKKAVALGANDGSVYFTLATVCARQGKAQEAAEYRRIFSSQKASASAETVRFQETYSAEFRRIAVAAICRAATVYDHYGQEAVAERLFQRALHLDPQSEVVCGELSMFCRSRQRLADAAALQQRLTEIDPSNVYHFINLANLSTQLGNFDAAEKSLQQVVQLRPNASLGYTGLAQLALQQGRSAQARNYAEASLRRRAANPHENVSAYLVLAAACERLGDQHTAAAALSAARKLSPDDPRLAPRDAESP